MNEDSLPIGKFASAEFINEHALALGHLCIYWATLDNVLTMMLEKLLNIDDLAAASLAAPDTSTKCEQIKRLAYARMPECEWRCCLIRMLDRIKGEMAEERNRYIHDDWNVSESGIIRIDRRPKVRKLQSRHPAQLIIASEKVTPVELIADLTKRIVDMMVAVTFMSNALPHWHRTRQLPEPPLKAIEVSNYRSQSSSP